jgi:hypothetical protein
VRRLLPLVLALAACREPASVPGSPDAAITRAHVGTLDGKPILWAPGAGLATLADGTPILARASERWTPLDTAPGNRIALDDGSWWASVRFGDGVAPPVTHWVTPAHTREELSRRLESITQEAARLPPSLSGRVQSLLPVIALVSATEGDFADRATHPADSMASIGIFQWAAERDTTRAAGSSLSRFFVTLKKRALAREDALFVAAWKQCTKLGFEVRGGNFRLRKKPATPAQVVERLGTALAEGALRTYQLIAAADWIDEVRQAVVRPSHRGGVLLGHGYAEAEAGRMVRFTVDERPFRLRAREVTTVGDLLRAPAALATAVSLGVNRPHYVEAALWQALAPTDAPARVDALLASPSEEALRTLLWPRPAQLDEDALLRAFRDRALELYRPNDRERRARRLVTALLVGPENSP